MYREIQAVLAHSPTSICWASEKLVQTLLDPRKKVGSSRLRWMPMQGVGGMEDTLPCGGKDEARALPMLHVVVGSACTVYTHV